MSVRRALRRPGPKLRSIAARKEFNPDLGIVLLVMVVLRNPLTYLGNRDSYNRIDRCVVVRGTIKDAYPEQPFLQKLSPASQGFLNDEAKQWRIATAILKMVAVKQTIELFPNVQTVFIAPG